MRRLYILTFLLSFNIHAEDLKPFSSDGCSAFPDGNFEHNKHWLACCTVHDFAYWQGGTYEQRKEADQSLRQCVEQVGEPEIAAIMLAGVRVGGTPFLPTNFRWGYGWSYPRFYRYLTEKEKLQIEDSIKISGSEKGFWIQAK